MKKADSFFRDKRFLVTISLLASFLLWIYISTVLRPTAETTVEGIGVNINVQSGILGQMGLSTIEGGETTVDVVISGTRSVIGGVTAEDISISPSLSGVSGAGVYSLELVASNASKKDFEILSLSPNTVSVKFDKYVDKTVPLFYRVIGDYNIPDEYVQGEIYTSPSEIIVTGPEKDLEDISSAVVQVELRGDYTETIAESGTVVLTDTDGNDLSYNRNEISIDKEKATVFIPVYERKELPVWFRFTNVPDFFDTTAVPYSLSSDLITVEGERAVLDKYSDLFLGFVDLRSITPENSSFTFDVTLPEGIQGMDDVTSVQLDFNMENYDSVTFRTNQIQIINIPKGYTVKSNTNQLAVKMVGSKEVLEQLTAKDIIVQIDLSEREINQTGQYRMSVKVLLPNGQAAWAEGSYYITVTIKES